MKYQEFFSITMEHSYFAGGIADLVLTPIAETKELLKKRGLLLKKTATGIRCLVGIDEENLSFSNKVQNDIFNFYVFPTSDIVGEFTDMSAVEAGKMIFFTNEKLGKDQLELVAGEINQEGTYHGFPALAKVEIKGTDLELESGGTSFTYHIQFAATALKWKYYFLANPDTNDITIQTSDKKIAFNELEGKEDFSDQIEESLQLNFPNSKILIFESDTLIPSRNSPIKDINLKKDGEVLIKHLPNPDCKHSGVQIIKIK